MDAAPEIVEGRSAFAARALEFVGVARTEILLLSFDLDRRLYGDEAFVETIRRFALTSERARLWVLLNQPQRAAAQGGHRLVELGRRLPSRIEFRELLPEQVEAGHGEVLIVDECAVLTREAPDSLEARCWRQAPLEARRRRGRLLALWQEAPPARELRVLGL